MEPEYAECPLYKSKTYYGVVIGGKKHKGWSCVFAGDGALKFRHNNGDERYFYHSRSEANSEDDNWMSRCWSDFLAMAETPNKV